MKNLIVALLSVLVLFQNCGPVAFKSEAPDEGAFLGPNGPGIVPPPGGPNCSGFEIRNPRSEVLIPAGQNGVLLSFEASLGNAEGPIAWTATPGFTIPKYGLTADYTFPKGEYVVRATTANQCSQSFTLRVIHSECKSQNPLSLLVQIDTPVADRKVGNQIRFSVPNFSQFTSLQVMWPDSRSWTPIASSPFTKIFDTAGSYNIPFKAIDLKCDQELTYNLPISIEPAQCVPTYNNLGAITRNPVNPRVGDTVQYTIQNRPVMKDQAIKMIVDGSVTYNFSAGQNVQFPVTMAKRYTVRFEATEPKCNTLLTANDEFTSQPPICVPTVQNLVVDMTDANGNIISGAANIFVGDPLRFVIRDHDKLRNITYNLGDGTSGSSYTAPIVHNYTLPNGVEERQFTATFTAMNSCDQSYQVTKTINVRVRKNQSEPLIIGQVENKPPLNMFFIIDNSATMLTEQTALKNAYDILFSSSNTTNLRRFDSKSYIVSTAQRSVADLRYDIYYNNIPYQCPSINVGDGRDDHPCRVNNILRDVYDPTRLLSYSYNQIMNGWGRSRDTNGNYTNVGRIAGDVVGYYDTYIRGFNPNQSAQYRVAPVVKYAAGPNGPSASQSTLQKFVEIRSNMNESQFNSAVADFKDRLSLLNPNSHNLDHYDPIVKKESGMCAVSRLLREGYVKSDVQNIFLVVSDEEESDILGQECLYSAGNRQMQQGRCGVPGTQFRYQTGYECRLIGNRPSTIRRCDWTRRGIAFREPIGTCIPRPDGTGCIPDQGWGPEVFIPNTTSCSEYDLQGWPCRIVNDQGTQNYSCPSNSTTCNCSDVNTTVPWQHYITVENVGECTTAQCPADVQNCQADIVGNEYATISIAAANLQCNSNCPSGQCPRSGGFYTGSISSYISMYLGGSGCTVANSGYIPGGPIVTVDINDPNKCNGLPFFPTGTVQNVTATERVHQGTNSLSQYIQSQFQQIHTASGMKPTLSTITYQRTSDIPQNNCDLGPSAECDSGASVGSQYMALADSLGFSNMKYPIYPNPDFRPFIQQLTNFIQQQLNTTFEFTLPAGMQIRKITLVRGATTYIVTGGYQYFPPSAGATAGTIKFTSPVTTNLGSIALQNNDTFTIEYW